MPAPKNPDNKVTDGRLAAVVDFNIFPIATEPGDDDKFNSGASLAAPPTHLAIAPHNALSLPLRPIRKTTRQTMTRLRYFVFPLLALIASPALPAQLVQFGPWSGGVTPHSAEVVLGLIEDRLTSIDVCLKPDFLRNDTLAENRRLLTAPPKLVRYTLTNLEPDTTYYYRIRAGNIKERERTGSFRTFPEEGRPTSFRFAIGADALTDSKSSVFSEIRFQKPRFFIHLGNFHSQPILTPDPAKYYDAFKTALISNNQTELYGSVRIVYTWDRSDFGGERANRRAQGHAGVRRGGEPP